MEDFKKSLESLKEVLNEEIKKVTKKADITPVELENMTKTLCLIEKIKMIEEGEEYWDDEGQSGRSYGYGNSGRSYGYGNSGRSYRASGNDMNSYGMPEPYYYDGMSGRRMRSPSTGRYVSGNRPYGMSEGYGYSGHSIKDRMIAKLESMYDEATTDHERQVVDEWIERLSGEKK